MAQLVTRIGVAAIPLLFLLAACGPPASQAPSSDPASRRSLPAGEVVGFRGKTGSHVWLGLPYAEPPLGSRRWKAPQAPARWEGVRQATRPGAHCPQLGSRFGGVTEVRVGAPTGDEDCLVLNVYAPVLAPEAVPGPGARLPVMVWIHGGGNVVGHAGLYDGGVLAREQGLVIVAVNYRLGPLGWFRHAGLRADAADAAEASGNFGTLDLIRALHWVQENIAAFGGDPERVTIFGESAGGRDVFSLLVSPPARGLFHRAIAQSGRAQLLEPAQGEDPADAPVPGHENSSHEVLRRLLGPEADSATASRLRGIPAFELIEAYRREQDEGLIDVPQLFADGVVLAREPLLDRLATPGGYHPVPAIFGTNRDENKVFLFAQPRLVQQVLGFYPRLRDPDFYDALAEALSNAWKVAGADAPAAAIARHGRSPVWVYRFDWDEEASVFGADLQRMLGASHGFEIPFVFGRFELGEASVIFDDANRPGREALSAKMRSYWAQFAASGDPGRGRHGDQPRWQPWDPRADAAKFLVLDTDADGGVRMQPGALDLEQVAARARRDPRLAADAKRCRVLYELARWTRSRDGGPTDARYAELGADACDAHPAASFAAGS